MKLHELLSQLRKDIIAKKRQLGFGARVGELRHHLAAARTCGRLEQPEFMEARSTLANIDEHHIRAIGIRIKCELDLPTHSPELLQDVARLQRFVEGARRIWELDESVALREAVCLLDELGRRGVAIPTPRPEKKAEANETGAELNVKPKKAPDRAYVHHPTLDDDYENEPRIFMILGGAFEMNRRKH